MREVSAGNLELNDAQVLVNAMATMKNARGQGRALQDPQFKFLRGRIDGEFGDVSGVLGGARKARATQAIATYTAEYLQMVETEEWAGMGQQARTEWLTRAQIEAIQIHGGGSIQAAGGVEGSVRFGAQIPQSEWDKVLVLRPDEILYLEAQFKLPAVDRDIRYFEILDRAGASGQDTLFIHQQSLLNKEGRSALKASPVIPRTQR